MFLNFLLVRGSFVGVETEVKRTAFCLLLGWCVTYLRPTHLSSGCLRHRLNLTLGATENRLFKVRLRFEKSVFLSLSEGAVLSLVLLLKVNQ